MAGNLFSQLRCNVSPTVKVGIQTNFTFSEMGISVYFVVFNLNIC